MHMLTFYGGHFESVSAKIKKSSDGRLRGCNWMTELVGPQGRLGAIHDP